MALDSQLSAQAINTPSIIFRRLKGRSSHGGNHSQSVSICHTSATTAILSPFFADTVIISGCMSIGSCALSVYPDAVETTCMGGVREGEGARLDRAVGDSEEVALLFMLVSDDWEMDLDMGVASDGGPAVGARPRGGYIGTEGL